MFYFRIEIKINHIDEITNNEKKIKNKKSLKMIVISFLKIITLVFFYKWQYNFEH